MVLNEPGVTIDRGDRAAMAIIEVLCRSGQDLIREDIVQNDPREGPSETYDFALREINVLVDSIDGYSKGRRASNELKRAWVPASAEEQAEGDPLHEEAFEHAVEAVLSLRAREYRPVAFVPSPRDLLPPAVVGIATSIIDGTSTLAQEQYRILMPEVLVPPEEEDEYEGAQFNFEPLSNEKKLSSKPGRGNKNKSVALAKADEEIRRAGAGPEGSGVYARWFLESTPLVGTPSAVVLRSLINDIVDLYEVNRKECARILFGIAKWLRKGTFAGKAVSPDTGLFGDAEDVAWCDADANDPEGGWTIDDVLVEVSTN